MPKITAKLSGATEAKRIWTSPRQPQNVRESSHNGNQEVLAENSWSSPKVEGTMTLDWSKAELSSSETNTSERGLIKNK